MPVRRFWSLIYAYYIPEQHLFESSFYLAIRVAIFDKRIDSIEIISNLVFHYQENFLPLLFGNLQEIYVLCKGDLSADH